MHDLPTRLTPAQAARATNVKEKAEAAAAAAAAAVAAEVARVAAEEQTGAEADEAARKKAEEEATTSAPVSFQNPLTDGQEPGLPPPDLRSNIDTVFDVEKPKPKRKEVGGLQESLTGDGDAASGEPDYDNPEETIMGESMTIVGGKTNEADPTKKILMGVACMALVVIIVALVHYMGASKKKSGGGDGVDGSSSMMMSASPPPPVCVSEVDWQDKTSNGCDVYTEKQWCTTGGVVGPGWNTAADGNIEDFAVNIDGVAAFTACCACGGGSTGSSGGNGAVKKPAGTAATATPAHTAGDAQPTIAGAPRRAAQRQSSPVVFASRRRHRLPHVCLRLPSWPLSVQRQSPSRLASLRHAQWLLTAQPLPRHQTSVVVQPSAPAHVTNSTRLCSRVNCVPEHVSS